MHNACRVGHGQALCRWKLYRRCTCLRSCRCRWQSTGEELRFAYIAGVASLSMPGFIKRDSTPWSQGWWSQQWLCIARAHAASHTWPHKHACITHTVTSFLAFHCCPQAAVLHKRAGNVLAAYLGPTSQCACTTAQAAGRLGMLHHRFTWGSA